MSDAGEAAPKAVVDALMRFCAIMLKLGDRLTWRGLAPVEANMPLQNGTTAALERLLGRQSA